MEAITRTTSSSMEATAAPAAISAVSATNKEAAAAPFRSVCSSPVASESTAQSSGGMTPEGEVDDDAGPGVPRDEPVIGDDTTGSPSGGPVPPGRRSPDEMAVLQAMLLDLEFHFIPDEDGEEEPGERTWKNVCTMVRVVGHGFKLRRVNKNRK